MTSISVIFPTRHLTGEAFLCQRAIQSCLDQTFADWRLIVVEYGADDATHALYRTTQGHLRDERLTWVYHPHLQHQGAAYQFALGHADPDTKLVAMLHEEYEWDPRYLEKVWQAWTAGRQIGMLYCDEQEYEISGEPVQWTPAPPEFDRRRLMDGGWMHLPAMALSYQQLTFLGGFDFLEPGVPDWDVALRLSRFGVYHIAEPLVKHHWSFSEDPQPARQQFFRPQIDFRLQGHLYGLEGPLTYERWLAPDSPQMRLNEARALILSGHDADGLGQLLALVRDHADFVPALLMLAEYSRAAGGLAQARQLYQRAADLDPTSQAAARLAELDSQTMPASAGAELSPLVSRLGRAVTVEEADRAEWQLRTILESEDVTQSIANLQNELDDTFLALVQMNAEQAHNDGQATLAEGLFNLFTYVKSIKQPVEVA